MSISALEGALMKKSYSNYQLCFTTKVKGKISCKISSLTHPHPKYNFFDNTIKTEKNCQNACFLTVFRFFFQFGLNLSAQTHQSVLHFGLPEIQGRVQCEEIMVFVFVFFYISQWCPPCNFFQIIKNKFIIQELFRKNYKGLTLT